MSETVTQTTTNGPAYTWLTAGFAWGSATGSAKTWLESYSDCLFTADVASTLALDEGLGKRPAISRSETLTVSEQSENIASFKLAFAVALAVAESCSRPASFVRLFDEVAAVSDGAAKNISSAIAEVLAVAEARSMSIAQALVESAHFAEIVDRLAYINLMFDESLGIAESRAQTVGLAKAVSLTLSDEMRRNAQAVISDILIGTGDISAASFQDMLLNAQAVGYAPFRPFTDGDYEYKDAIFKATLEATAASRLRLERLTLNVDVPDIFDRGSVSVPTAGLAVSFNRTFNVPPEVTITLKGGTVFAVPRLRGAITKLGFEVEIRDSANALVAGEVSWAAHGY